jgi:hypothetical protein
MRIITYDSDPLESTSLTAGYSCSMTTQWVEDYRKGKRLSGPRHRASSRRRRQHTAAGRLSAYKSDTCRWGLGKMERENEQGREYYW